MPSIEEINTDEASNKSSEIKNEIPIETVKDVEKTELPAKPIVQKPRENTGPK